MKKYFLIATIAIVLISQMSSMTYEQQSIVPFLQTYFANKPFEQALRSIEILYWNRIISVDTSGYYYFVEFLIRKATHFFGYGFVGVIFYGIYRHLRWRFPALIAIISIFVIASLDEYRQSLTPGRTGIFQDVLLDTCGAVVCISFFALLLFIVRGTTKVQSQKMGGH